MVTRAMSAMATDDAIAGTERLLAQGTDGSVIVVDTLTAYVIDELVGADTISPTAGDALLVERAGAEGTFDLDVLVTYVLSAAFASAAVTSTVSGDLLVLKRSTAYKRITIDNLTTSILSGVQATALDLTGLTAATPASGDLFLFGSGATPKKITRANLETQLWADFATYVAALGEDTLVAGNDKLYCIQGGTPKWVDPDALAIYFAVPDGDVIGPITTTESNIPQWDTTAKTLKDGLGLRTTVRTVVGGASDSYVPTEQAVAEYVAGITTLDIDGASDIGEALADADLIIVDNNAAGNNVKCAMSRVFTYIEDKIQALTDKATPVDADILVIQDSGADSVLKELTVAHLWDNRYVLDAKGIKLDEFTACTDVTTLNASTSAHGLVVKATAPAANTLNVVGIANTETAYTNKTLFDATNPAALGTAGPGTAVVAAHRDHVHGMPKLDDLTTPDDNTDLDAATGLHGLMSKTDKVKLDGIEALADVTDATNVNAAGATMNADTDVSGNGWVLDEDAMTSNSATKVPTQQSVKAYVDNVAGTQNKLDATVDPDPLIDDITLGYSPGSIWANLTTDEAFICLDNTNGAAVWESMTQAAAGWDGDILDIDFASGADIGAALTATDQLIVADDSDADAAKRCALSRVKTYTDNLNTASYATDQLLSVAECNGYVVYVTGAAIITLRPIAAGMSVTIITIGNVAVSVNPDDADKILLDGVALNDGYKITNGSTAGDIAVLTYYSADGWHASTNGWTDTGA